MQIKLHNENRALGEGRNILYLFYLYLDQMYLGICLERQTPTTDDIKIYNEE